MTNGLGGNPFLDLIPGINISATLTANPGSLVDLLRPVINVTIFTIRLPMGTGFSVQVLRREFL